MAGHHHIGCDCSCTTKQDVRDDAVAAHAFLRNDLVVTSLLFARCLWQAVGSTTGECSDFDSSLRHSGARASAREPGIHKPGPWLWIPGPRPLGASRKDGNETDVRDTTRDGGKRCLIEPRRCCLPSWGS